MRTFDHTPHRPTTRTRRTALAALCAALSLTLAACGGGKGTAGAQSTGKAVPGDTLTVAEQQAPPTMNPGSLDLGFVDFTMLSYESLFYLSPEGKVEPALAKSWKYVGTGNTELSVTLRSGVKFADGTAVTADAVKASLEYAKKAQGNQAHYLTDATITATGPLALTIKLAEPNPILPTLLTQSYGIGQIISPKGLASASSLTPTKTSQGAGPYIYEPSDSVAGDHYTYTANPNYYDKSKQHYKKIVIRIVQNGQTAVNAMKTGQIDVYKGDYTSAASAKSAGMSTVGLPVILQGLSLIDREGEVSKPLGDVRVRQAINYAIDREAVTKALLGSSGTPTTQTVIKGGDGYSEDMADHYPYNPTKAKQLLKEAGYADGFELPVLAATFVGFDTMAEAIAGQLSKVGIKVKVTAVTSITSFVENQTNHKYPAVSGGFTEEPMYLEGLDLFMPGSKVFNGFGTTSPELTKLFDEAAAAAPDKRADLDRQMQEYLVKNAWFAPVAFTPVNYYVRPGIGGVKVSAGAPFASPLAFYATK
ncbi:ABC transporter substrate-binding protein [Streptomyces sp. NBC_00582]|uniref:ABC transporter substrate-binding protein n=1 Tax=Streptomyces sp. NBC_00582 TaxID=2975783 RepID=UPI002E801E36|nr:ABC transporter substrate-binding protein [Streptomyces sp. NBC_00582]WUB67115.1 ABC transporter substrate-binding protein [Streptomyces sp. NBC_00582]